MKAVKTFEEACKALNIDPKHLPDVSVLPANHQKAIVAHYKLVIVAEALNGGWKPNWNDFNEGKYYPWFNVKTTKKNTSGVGLSYYDYYYDITNTHVGSRLVFKTSELAKYAGTKFKKLYEESYLLGN